MWLLNTVKTDVDYINMIELKKVFKMSKNRKATAPDNANLKLFK